MEHTRLGTDAAGKPVALTLLERLRQIAVLGKTGMGKSTLLRSIMAQDIARGDGLLLIDPHGTLAEECLALVPPQRRNQVCVFDLADGDYPIAFNIFADVPADDRELLAEGIVSAMFTIWGGSWGPQLERILRNSLIVLLDSPHISFLHIPRFLTDSEFRARVVKRARNPVARAFFEGQGFDKFYGFIGGETDQWYPLIYDGVIKVDPPKMQDYHFSVDMTNQAINWVKAQQSMTPDKPFFVYYATGAVHAPHHVPKEWADKYKGQFDKGWDQIRNETLERQKKLGVIPANTQLGERPKDLAAWDTLPAEHRRLFARQAEVFAGFLEHTDDQIGRLRKALEDIGVLDNTLFIYIAGDNGTSAEGGFVGMYNEMTYFNGVAEKVEDLIPLIDKWGGPETFPHMSAGWAVAFDTPFSWTKQVASDFGGTRNGTVIHWPKRITEKGGLRSQFSHVIDIAPTILEAAGLPEPKIVNGTPQTPIEGTSLVYTFANATAPERHTTQYFEMFGNRAIYRDGWFARTLHRAPWQTGDQKPLSSDVWDLYDTRNDFSLTQNLAAAQPAKLKEMQELFMKEAEKYNVLPIDDRVIVRMNPATAGRPDLLGDRTSLTLYEGMQGMLENTFMNIKNRSSKITAELAIPTGGANGAILSQGGRFGGWSLYMKDGKPAYTYNFLGLARYTVAAPQALTPGATTVTLDFAYDGGGSGKGGKAILYVNGKSVAEGRVEKTQPNVFSADETADVGIDNQTPVAEGIGIGSETRFTGKINKITLEVGPLK